jgi:glycosyltransferase involved in cell wall biosynthesis
MGRSHMDVRHLVSAIIPAHNCENTIGRAVRSVLAQGYDATEIIVVDDGSTDGTRRVSETYGSSVRCIVQARAGAAVARNRAISESRGAFVAFLDSDDEWLPGRIEKGIAPMLADDSVGLTFCRLYRVYADGGRDIYGEAYEKCRVFPRLLWPSGYVQTSGATCRRTAVEEMGRLDASLRSHDEVDLWIRLEEAFSTVEIEEPLALYHETPGSLSKRWDLLHAEEDYYRVIERAMGRHPERYGPHRDVIMADAHLHWGIYYLSRGNHRRARMYLRRSFATKPTLRTIAILAAAFFPRGPVEAGLAGLKQGINRMAARRRDRARPAGSTG